MGTGTKEDESSTGCVWAAGFHHAKARSRLGARFETYEHFISLIFKFLFSDRGKMQITDTADTESVDKGARLYCFYTRSQNCEKRMEQLGSR